MQNESFILNLITIALFAPLVGSAIVLLGTRRLIFKMAGPVTTGILGVAFLCSLIAAITWSGADNPQPIIVNVPWIPLAGTEAGWLYLGIMIDSLTIAMVTMVTLIATLVHLYSMGYMAGDPRYNRFFGYLSLFTFSMMGIITANSIMMLFVFWELVGLTSYLLIGFWFEKRGPQLACKKAFVMNRIGDMGFLTGFGILFYQLGGKVLLPSAGGEGSLFEAIALEIGPEAIMANPPGWLTAAGIGLFFGAIGKSAQFPLHTWLPDAMEGPTPVSSIVHSATMVAAGVYLTARIYPILTPGAHLFIATIGLITLVMAACMALVMTDIKRVLAYSTLSQLGYMILGLGSGAYAFALFHLITHAFFKCCLFQCAGSVINAAHHQQDMRYYGGLGKKMPITKWCYLLCTLAISGASIPILNIGLASGYYSKDGIIAGAYNFGHTLASSEHGWWAAKAFYWGPTAVAYLTVFYMARSYVLTFHGKPRDQHLHDHAHEAPKTMLVSQVILTVLAVFAACLPFLSLINGSAPAVDWVQPGVAGHSEGEPMYQSFHFVHGALLHGFGWMLALGAGILMYRNGFGIAEKVVAVPGVNLLYTWAKNKFYFDDLYDTFAVTFSKAVAQVASVFDKYLVDGLVNLSGWSVKAWSEGVGVFDNRVVDGAVNGAAAMAQSGGQILRVTQGGRIRGYVMLLFASATVVSLIVVTVVLVQSPG